LLRSGRGSEKGDDSEVKGKVTGKGGKRRKTRVYKRRK
jgi:hypothetical protein